MKEDKYENNLSLQDSGLCEFSYGRYSEKCFTQIIVILCMETPSWYPPQGHQEDFQTDPLIHPGFLEITPHKFYKL